MEYEAIKNIAEAIKDMMVSVGLLVGGMWALLQFLTLRHDQHVKEQSILRFELEIEQVSVPDREGLFLSIVVRARNQGSRNTYLEYDSNDHLTVTPVSILADGTRRLGVPIKRVIMRGDHAIKRDVVLSGSYTDMPFFVSVPAPGLYVVRYYVEPNEEQRRNILRSGGIGEKDSIVISANKYVLVALKEHRPAEARAATPQGSIY